MNLINLYFKNNIKRLNNNLSNKIKDLIINK